MKPVVIVTTTSPRIAELSALTLPNKQAYAARHDYMPVDVVQFDDEPGGYGRGFKSLLCQVLAHLAYGRIVLQIDADAIITALAQPIDSVLRPSDDVVMAGEPAPNCIVNGGVVLYNPTQRAAHYIGQLLCVFDQWKDDPLVVQGWVANHMEDPAIFRALRIVRSDVMNSLTEERPDFPHVDPCQVWHPGDWIAHAYGYPIPRKIEMLSKILHVIAP